MSRIYTIEIMEFDGVYYPTKHKTKVKADNLEEALKKVLNYHEYFAINDYEIEQSKEKLIEDGYGVMTGRTSNEFIALVYNNILDVGRKSKYRLLKGYVGKRKCFDLVADMEENLW